MMGLPNLPKKLPSRNWMIFFTLTGSLFAAVTYDKREKKRAQAKWCKLVEHIKNEPLPAGTMPRKLTVFLQAPPNDGLRYSQDHFKDYVKPLLVASGLDWEFIQGRKEGDVRAEYAEKIRKLRGAVIDGEPEDIMRQVRINNGIKEFDGPQGDIIIGRNTWKEYVRGLHEGWLGPLIAPAQAGITASSVETETATKTDAGITLVGESREATPEEVAALGLTESEEDKKKKKKPPQPKPFIQTSEYDSAQIPSQLSTEFSPSNAISMPHILGFLKTPQRFWRFIHRRELADDIGREVAAIILNSYSRPYQLDMGSLVEEQPSSDSDASLPNDRSSPPQTSEQAQTLIHEEREWHKSTRLPIEKVEVQPERVWAEPMVLDSRIASRMRKAQLSEEDEARAATIKVSEEEIEGSIKRTLRKIIRDTVGWAKGDGKDQGPVLGDLDHDSVTGEGPVSESRPFVPGTVGGMRMPQPGNRQW